MQYKIIIAGFTILVAIFPVFAKWELIWSDEFEYNGLPDKSKWGYDIGNGSNGWGNNELQYYTKDSLKNARVENGTLIITARKEVKEQNSYTSARLVTLKKGDWRYGRFEIAAKLPKGRGLWPAIWMLPSERLYGEWPRSGELDIMENVGFDSMKVHFNIHTEAYNHSIGTNKGATVTLEEPHSRFNNYTLEWYEDSVIFFVDDKRAFSFKNEHTGAATWPFDQQFHLLLNIAIGGSWGGQKGVDESLFPREMIIDYVRVYKLVSTSIENKNEWYSLDTSRIITFGKKELTVFRYGEMTINVFTIDGKKMLSRSIQSKASCYHIPCSFPLGMYIVVLNTGTSQYVQYILNSDR